MGFGLPAALGAKTAFPDQNVLLFTYDGSFLMKIQELDSEIREYALIKVSFNEEHKTEIYHLVDFYKAEIIDIFDGAAINSLIGASSENIDVYRVIIKCTVTPNGLEKIVKQLHKLIDIIDVQYVRIIGDKACGGSILAAVHQGFETALTI